MSMWNNVSHIIGTFTENPGSVESNIGSIPNWQKMSGHLAGTTPRIPNLPSSRPQPNTASFLSQFPNTLKIAH